MKKLFFIFIVLLGISSVFAEDFIIDVPPTLKKYTASEISGYNSAKIPAKPAKKKEGFLNKFFNSKQKPEFDEDSKGYSGNLPDIESEFKYKIPKTSAPKEKGTSADDYTPEEFQKSKMDDPLFLDVILNKENPSKYNIDMIKIVDFLERFRVIIENHENIQKFNANVNILDLNARRIAKLYADKPESMSPSYYKLQDLAYKAKILGNLKFDANYYSQFSPVGGTKYAPENIANEENKLLSDLDKTIFEIKQLDNPQ